MPWAMDAIYIIYSNLINHSAAVDTVDVVVDDQIDVVDVLDVSDVVVDDMSIDVTEIASISKASSWRLSFSLPKWNPWRRAFACRRECRRHRQMCRASGR